jgi:hypothetical protein
MYEITFTNTHRGGQDIECNYPVRLNTIPAKGSTLTLNEINYRVGDAHWDIGYSPFERGASITVKVELQPTFLSP